MTDENLVRMPAVKPALVEVNDAVLRYPTSRMERGSIKTTVLSPFARRMTPTYVEALHGVSFTVREHERVALIGRNGAGKSTILRAIAGIYPLSNGSITLHDEPRGMFDLGIGFEMEETGRANIYYRGFLLGLRRAEIEALEQSIIDFSGLGDSIDLPLKTYSAGMQVRLAFSISTASEGAILLIDEVLAAGDAEFVAKARTRMVELIHRAACMVLVTHDMGAVRELCTRALWIDKGWVRADGPVAQVVAQYEEAVYGPPLSNTDDDGAQAAQ